MDHSTSSADAAVPLAPVRVWDLPTRVFHWTLMLAVVGLVITGNVGGGAMVWHFRLGYLVLALLIFRLLWALVGGYWSRLMQLLPSPSALRAEIARAGLTWTETDAGTLDFLRRTALVFGRHDQLAALDKRREDIQQRSIEIDGRELQGTAGVAQFHIA